MNLYDLLQDNAGVNITINSDMLNTLLDDVQPVDFKAIIHPNATENEKVTAPDRQKYVVIVEELLRLATVRQWGICKNAAFVYLYNGAFWSELDKEVLQNFLGSSAERMNMPKYDARQYTVREHLLKQFLVTGFQAMPENNEKILINLKNGTFEIDNEGNGILRPVNKADFLKYQLPFEYIPNIQQNFVTEKSIYE